MGTLILKHETVLFSKDTLIKISVPKELFLTLHYFRIFLQVAKRVIVNDDESCEICKLVATELDQVLDEDSTQVN